MAKRGSTHHHPKRLAPHYRSVDASGQMASGIDQEHRYSARLFAPGSVTCGGGLCAGGGHTNGRAAIMRFGGGRWVGARAEWLWNTVTISVLAKKRVKAFTQSVIFRVLYLDPSRTRKRLGSSYARSSCSARELLVSTKPS
jgi:hypothetical protein